MSMVHDSTQKNSSQSSSSGTTPFIEYLRPLENVKNDIRLERKEKLCVHGKGTPRRSYLYVDDAAEAYRRVALNVDVRPALCSDRMMILKGLVLWRSRPNL